MEASEIARKTYKFTWKIKNFSFCWHRDCEHIYSPPFQVHTGETLPWRLLLYPNNGGIIHCVCVAYPNPDPFHFSIGYELAFLSKNESILISVKVPNADFEDVKNFAFVEVVRDTVFGEERSAFLPDDTLTIQCKIWGFEGSILESDWCFAETEIEVQRYNSVWSIERFSSIQEGQKVYQDLHFTPTRKRRFILDLYMTDSKCFIEIRPLDHKSVKFFKFELCLRDAARKRMKCGRWEFPSKVKTTIALTHMKKILMQNKSRYLPNDLLILQYEMEFSTGRTEENIEDIVRMGALELGRMEALEEDRKNFTFTWKIKNFSFSWHRGNQCIFSPPFQVHKKDSVPWRLRLIPNNAGTYIYCKCVPNSRHVQSSFAVGYELAFLTRDESTLNSVEVSNADVLLRVQRSVVFGEERDVFLPNDTLTIQCRIFASEDSILETGRCFAETEIEVQRNSSVWTIERFSSIKEGDEIIQNLDLPSTAKPCFIFSLHLTDGMYITEINPLDAKSVKFCKCQLFLLDAAGKREKRERYEFLSNSRETYKLGLDQNNLMKNKSKYLPNDVLTMQFEIEFSTGIETGKIWKILETDSSTDLVEVTDSVTTYNFLYSVENNTYNNADNFLQSVENNTDNCLKSVENNTDNFQHSVENNTDDNTDDLVQSVESNTDNFLQSVENNKESSLSWKDDLLIIFNDGLFCDTILKTSSESFPVHSLILRIWSPVFSDLLCVDDSEGLKEGVNIEDLDTNTVRKMVSYLYTDTLDDLDWESAKNLYCASVKYQITSLKQVCVSFLKKNLQPTNCCEILCMAGRYLDHGLISAVQSFISKHSKQILCSDAWINLEANYSLLACETLRKLYLSKLAEIMSAV